MTFRQNTKHNGFFCLMRINGNVTYKFDNGSGFVMTNVLILLGSAQSVIPPNLYSFMNIIAWGPQVMLHL